MALAEGSQLRVASVSVMSLAVTPEGRRHRSGSGAISYQRPSWKLAPAALVALTLYHIPGTTCE